MTIVVFFLFSDGIGWTDAQKTVLVDLDDIQLEQCQFELNFTFNLDHTEEMFTQSIIPTSRSKSFVFFVLSEEVPFLEWQQFECPMSFPQCPYDWCVTGDNNEVVNMSDMYKFL
jgi:hypothetical protein